MGVRVDLNVSLDGYATTEGGTPDNPMGEDWTKLTAAYAATRTFRERVFHDTSGEGTTGVDDRYAAAYAIAPILTLGRGINLWSDFRGFEDSYEVRTETAESGTVRVTFTRPS